MALASIEIILGCETCISLVQLRLLRAYEDIASTCRDPRVVGSLIERGQLVLAGCAARLSVDSWCGSRDD